MKFNPTLLEIATFLLVCSAVYVWTKHGKRIHRWLQNYFRQRRGPRNLKPKSPEDCPQCNRDSTLLPYRARSDVLPWPERKSRRGRPKVTNTAGHACLNPSCYYFAIADPAVHALVSNGRRDKQQILYFKCQACGGCRTSRFATPLYWLKTPISQIAMVMTALSEGVDISAATRIVGHHGLFRLLAQSAPCSQIPLVPGHASAGLAHLLPLQHHSPRHPRTHPFRLEGALPQRPGANSLC